jgi:hypothetical protein
MDEFMSSTRITIVYHSGHGHTRRQAEAVKAGVEQVESTEALRLTVEEAQTRWDDLASADAIIFGAPMQTCCRQHVKPDGKRRTDAVWTDNRSSGPARGDAGSSAWLRVWAGFTCATASCACACRCAVCVRNLSIG